MSPPDTVLGHEIQDALAAQQWQRAAELLERWCATNPVSGLNKGPKEQRKPT